MNSFSTRLRGSLRIALPVIVGVSFAVLTPVAAAASNTGGLAALQEAVQVLTGQVNGNSSEVTSLKGEVAVQQQQIEQLTQSLASETAARKAGDAGTLSSANQYTDNQVAGEQNRAEAAEQALNNAIAGLPSGGSDDDSATLAAANSYTDTQVGGETSRAKAAESSLQSQLDAEIARAKLAELAAITAAVNKTEANLNIVASGVTSGEEFWSAIFNNSWP